MKFFLLMVKNVARNPLRSVLTALGSMVLVFVVTIVWSVLSFLNTVTTEKKENLKAIVTDRWVIPSRLPSDYERPLSEGASNPERRGDVKPLDYMTWQFYVGSLDPKKLARENFVIAVAMDASKVTTMMEGLDSLTGEQEEEAERLVAAMKQNRQGLVVGKNVLRNMNKRVGERVKVSGIGNFKELDFEFVILGVIPEPRYDNINVMNREFLDETLDAFPRTHNGRKHLMADRRLNLVWLKLGDTAAFTQVAKQIDSAPQLRTPTVKCETAASSFGAFMEAFRDLIWGMQWLLAPGCLISLSLVMANAISINVRERRAELAVLKVLGYRPWQVLVLVLGESLLLGAGAGLFSGGLTYAIVNWVLGGIPLLGFFGVCLVPADALWWGAAVGAATSLAGSLLPAWSARNVKVADVFAKVA
jgi:putative ABC transport system permease protein